MRKEVVLGEDSIDIHHVISVAKHHSRVSLSSAASFRERIEKSVRFLESEWQSSRTVYGVTTGYGKSADRSVPSELVEKLPHQLVQFHGCGLGKPLSMEVARATLLARLCSFTPGVSGVRYVVLERICELLNKNVIPVIPEEGSVGASGDLTPLSYLAAVLMGQRTVYFQGQEAQASEVFLESIH